MIPIKSFSRRSLFWLLLLVLIDVAVIYGAGYIFAQIRAFFLPVSIGLFFLFAIIEWLVIRAVFVRAMRRAGLEESVRNPVTESGAKKKSAATAQTETEKAGAGPDKKELREQNRRYYLHMLAVLQREGRLVDFLEEDLSAYDDAQIGAAVRSIHENCHKTLDKYLSPKPVLEHGEGDEIRVSADFDPATIKLTGNVTGEPPFSGIVRHRGWRAGKLELPALSGSGDAKVIAPAEVEIP